MLASARNARVLVPVCLLALLSASPASGETAAVLEGDPPTGPGLSAEDWSGIRQAHETTRHHAVPVTLGLQARNPGQRWSTSFDGRGFTIDPDDGVWSWGLELESYGFSGATQVFRETTCSHAEGARVVYEWTPELEEWFVNDSRGLEHGFTLRSRPAGGAGGGPLFLTLGVRGTLHPEVEANGRDVRFVDESGACVVTYTGLLVLDADGRELDARFEGSADRLLLSIDDCGARYPITIDPIAQQAYLKASNTDPGDVFGKAVAISGDTVVVGALNESSKATGVNGDQSDNSCQFSGAAYVFVRHGATWAQEAYLKASNTDAGDNFGMSVAVDGDTVVVGAFVEDSSATGVNGDDLDNTAMYAGAAFVFVRNGATWTQEAYLKASNTDAGDYFGLGVAVSGDTVVVGAMEEASSATGVNGDESDNSYPGAGAAYVFVRNGTSWSQEAYLKASNAAAGFGESVAVSGDTVLVGARRERSAATGVDGDQSDTSALQAGAAYVFRRAGTSWAQEAYLKASNTDAGDWFGLAVAIDGDTAVVGAPREDSTATGVDGDGSDNSAPDSGAVYVFGRVGATWSQEAYLKASNTGEEDYFGGSVDVSGESVMIGAPQECSGATGVDGDQADDSHLWAGAAYLFSRVGTSWDQRAYLKASNTGPHDRFGTDVAISGPAAAVGAYGESSAATGVNGDQSDNSTTSSGAAYLFDLRAPGTPYCFGDAGSGTPCPCGNDNDGSAPGSGCASGVFASGARLEATGSASVASDSLTLLCTHLEPGNAGLYFQGNNDLSPGLPWGDGLRCAGGDVRRLEVRFADAAGSSNTTIALAAKAGNVQPGDTKHYQCWYRTIVNPPCGAGVNDFNTSNGYSVTWTP